jgi:RNA polymerase sigma factor (sigma-70 family)
MADHPGTILQKQIRELVAAQCPTQRSDMHLLQQFISDRDESAFATLVKRHGNMVLSVCRSVLKHQQDAEDAFQAAFLVLARKANAIRKKDALGSWLHGVAYRLSLKASAKAGRRRERVLLNHDPVAADSVDDLTLRELHAILHEEMARLGESYRTPLLLCYWQGMTRDQAAEQLGMTPDTFKKRLERARLLLGNRLARRGLALSAAGLAPLFPTIGAQAAVPLTLVNTTAQAALAFSLGNTAGVSAPVLALANGAIHSMNLTRWTILALSVLLLGGLGAGLGHHAFFTHAGDPQPIQPDARPPLPDGVPPKTDTQRIVGAWRVESASSRGITIPELSTRLMRFRFSTGGDMTFSVADNDTRAKFTLSGRDKIDWFTPKDANRTLGLYQFDNDDALVLCLGEGAANVRPAKFGAPKEGKELLYVLRRCKPGEENLTKAELDEAQEKNDEAEQAMSLNTFKQIGLAFHNYNAVAKAFPAHAIYSKDGKTPLLSWRVAILPYIEHERLYREFKLDEAWDSPHNKKLIPKMPRFFTGFGAIKAKEGETHYQLFTGPGTPFDGPKGPTFGDITDGTSKTVLAVEAKDAVIWTRPADLTLPADAKKLPAVGGLFAKGFNVVMFDGSARLVPLTIEPATFRAMITPRGGD